MKEVLDQVIAGAAALWGRKLVRYAAVAFVAATLLSSAFGGCCGCGVGCAVRRGVDDTGEARP